MNQRNYYLLLSITYIYYFYYRIWDILESLLEREKNLRFSNGMFPSSTSLSSSFSLPISTSPTLDEQNNSQNQQKNHPRKSRFLSRDMYSVSNLLVYQPSSIERNEINGVIENETKSDNLNDETNSLENQSNESLTEDEISTIKLKLKQLENEYHFLKNKLKYGRKLEQNSNDNQVSEQDTFITNSYHM